MEAVLKHLSRQTRFRQPFGAVTPFTEVTLRLQAPPETRAWVRLWDGAEHLLPMEWADGMLQATVTPEKAGLLWYYFIADTPQGRQYCKNGDKESFQITVYDRFSVPDWCSGAVMYQIFPDRFAGSGAFCVPPGKSAHKNWDDAPDYLPDPQKGYYAANDFFGGTLKGIEEKLPYLTGLGVSVIYLNPIFSAYSNHRYDCADYETVDRLLGTNEDFSHLCAAAKKAGIRVLLDGVFSHTGSDSKYFDREGTYGKGACDGCQPYKSWYSFRHFPDDYECWWGVWSLPCVNETEPSYMDYILRDDNAVIKRWLRAGASGWRLDVADELPDEFLFELRRMVKKEFPDALILGEVWEDASNKISYGNMRPYLLGGQLDSVMNYPLREAVIDYVLRKDAALFCERTDTLRENYPPQCFYALMNFLSTHDTQRIMTVMGEAPELDKAGQAAFRLNDDARVLAEGRVRLAYALIFCLPGMPCIYYGDEAALEGYADPFNRGTLPRGHGKLYDYISALSGLRAEHAITTGTLELQGNGSLLTVTRRGDSVITAVFNAADCEFEGIIPAKGRMIFHSEPGTVLAEREEGLYLLLPPLGCAVAKAEKD